MSSLLIIGAGGYGKLVGELAVECGYDKIAFLDDNSTEAIGKIEDYERFSDEYDSFVVAIGNPKVRKALTEKLKNTYELVTLISPKAHVSKSAKLGKGCIIEPMAVVNTSTAVGDACIINAGAVINHDAIVGDYCQIDCNAVVSARAVVPDNTKILCGQIWEEKK